MLLHSLEQSPDIADRSYWASTLGVSARTPARAEARGLRAFRPNLRTVLYRKEDIKSYLTPQN